MKKIILVVAIAALAIMAVASSASATVARCTASAPVNTTVTTAKFTMIQPANGYEQWSNVWTHDFTVTVNADNSFNGTGIQTGHDANGDYTGHWTISGKFNRVDNKVSFVATRTEDNLVLALDNAVTDNSAIAIAKLSMNGITLNTPPIEEKVSQPVFTSDTTTTTPGTECPATTAAGSIWYENPGHGLANFTFSGYDGGPSASDKGTGLYTDKSGYYTVKAADVVGIDKTSMKVTMVVTYSKHPAVKAGLVLTFIVNDAPGAPDYLTYEGTNFVAKAGNILVF